jgi:hypothetical protein
MRVDRPVGYLFACEVGSESSQQAGGSEFSSYLAIVFRGGLSNFEREIANSGR